MSDGITGDARFRSFIENLTCKGSEERLRLLESVALNANDAIIITEAEPISLPGPRILYVNKAFTCMTGYSLNEVVGRTPRLLQGPKSDRTVLDQIRKALTQWRPIVAEVLNYAKDGSEYWAEISIVPVTDEVGYFTHFVSIQRDVTKRKQIEEVLRSSKEQSESIIRHTSDAIWVIDTLTTVIQVNPAFEKLYGWQMHEVVGRNLPTVPSNMMNEFDSMLYSVKAGEKVNGFETINVTKDGIIINVSVTVSPIRDSAGSIIAFSGILRDITKRKEMEEVLRKADRLALVGQLAAGFAHEIRNPLTTIKGFFKLLEPIIQQKESYLSIISSELGQIESIINEFLTLAEPQLGSIELHSLSKVAEKSIALLNTQAIISNVQIFTEFETNVPQVPCDACQIKQVFANILKNAIESMPGGGHVFVQLKKQDSDYVLIRFVDEGHGMSKDRIAKLGEPFYTTKEKGTGLGLMVSYKIIQEHSGQIVIDSDINVGTSVTITLPLSR